MDEVDFFLAALAGIGIQFVESQLARCVARDALEGHSSPDFLHTSGRPNRYNPAGVECVYFGEQLDVAMMEYERQMAGLPGAARPFTIFRANVKLPVLDLTESATLARLSLTQEELRSPWRLAKSSTRTQLLGEAVSRQTRFAAIRYPSVAAHARGTVGCGLVIFRNGVRAPAFVRIIGPTDIPLGQWP